MTSEIRIYGHSQLVFWWLGWVVSLILALATALVGETVTIAQGAPERFLPGTTPHLIFAATLLFLVLFTNVKMRGIYSVAFVTATMFVILLFAYLDWWQVIFRWLPYLTVHVNLGFYLLFGTALLLVWLAAFFLFDRLTFWRVRPGQIVEERLIGGAQRTFDTDGLQFEQRPADLFQQTLLGFGAGDLILRTGGVNRTEILIPNVLLANDKIRRAQALIAVKLDAPVVTATG